MNPLSSLENRLIELISPHIEGPSKDVLKKVRIVLKGKDKSRNLPILGNAVSEINQKDLTLALEATRRYITKVLYNDETDLPGLRVPLIQATDELFSINEVTAFHADKYLEELRKNPKRVPDNLQLSRERLVEILEQLTKK